MGFNIVPTLANYEEPAALSLSNDENFLNMLPISNAPAVMRTASINVQTGAINWPTATLIVAIPDGETLVFTPTTDFTQAGGRVYLVSVTNRSITANNLRNALLTEPFIAANFDVSVPLIVTGGVLGNGTTIFIESKVAGIQINIALSVGGPGLVLSNIVPVSNNNDSRTLGGAFLKYDLQYFENPDVFLGQNDEPTTAAKTGDFIVETSKTLVAKEAFWFNVNAVAGQQQRYNEDVRKATGWVDPGTLSKYRVMLLPSAGLNIYVYASNTLRVLTGYSREPLTLSEYVFNPSGSAFKLLTKKPKTSYVVGQKEFLTFIQSDPNRGAPIVPETNYFFSIIYKAYDYAGGYLGEFESNQVDKLDLDEIATTPLEIAAAIDSIQSSFPGKEVAGVKVFLAVTFPDLFTPATIVSNALEYMVRPAEITTLNEFVFLNSLGGWDAFNTCSETRDTFKIDRETFDKTTTPTFVAGDEKEATHTADLDEEFTIECAPIQDEEAEWIKELAASKAVFYQDRAVLISAIDFTRDNTDYYRPLIKFRYSETYTNV